MHLRVFSICFRMGYASSALLSGITELVLDAFKSKMYCARCLYGTQHRIVCTTLYFQDCQDINALQLFVTFLFHVIFFFC